MPPASSLRAVRAAGSVLSLLVACGLGGCVEAGPEIQVAAGDIRNAIAKGQLTNPRAATVALVSLEGVPAAIESRFRQDLTTEAAAREVAFTDTASARYLLRAYLSAYPGDRGMTVAYTYDVFDAATKQRQSRVSDTCYVPAISGDAWAAVSDAVLESLAARSTDDLAVTLGGTPEARDAASKVAAAPGAAAKPVD